MTENRVSKDDLLSLLSSSPDWADWSATGWTGQQATLREKAKDNVRGQTGSLDDWGNPTEFVVSDTGDLAGIVSRLQESLEFDAYTESRFTEFVTDHGKVPVDSLYADDAHYSIIGKRWSSPDYEGQNKERAAFVLDWSYPFAVLYTRK